MLIFITLFYCCWKEGFNSLPKLWKGTVFFTLIFTFKDQRKQTTENVLCVSELICLYVDPPKSQCKECKMNILVATDKALAITEV